MKQFTRKQKGKDADGVVPEQLLDLRRPNPAANDELDQTAPAANEQANSLSLQSSLGNAAVARMLIQRKADGEETSETDGGAAETGAAPDQAATVAAPVAAAARTLIVDDNAETVEPGQMKKSEFLAQLRAAVCSTTADALAGSPFAAAATPYVDQAFAQYAAQDSMQLERSIRRYAPEAASVTNAGGLIPIVTARVRRSIATWMTTGEAPEGSPLGLPGAGALGVVGAVASSVTDAAAGVVSTIGSGISAVGNLLFKERDGEARTDSDPQAVQSQLGGGQSLDAGVKKRMESAFGESFSGVEVHADAKGAELSESLNARAFTVGQHIAFGTAEYKPGTLIGDALIAHELAHVMQQRGSASEGLAQKGGTESGGLERDADQAAVGAVISIWGGAKKGLAKVATSALPSLKSGLRLQRCGGKSKTTPATGLTDQQAQDAITHNGALGYDAATIRTLQTLVGATASGVWDRQTIEKIAVWQTAQSLTANGKIEAATLRAMILALVASSSYDEVIHVIVDAFNFPTANLGRIYYDSTATGADAYTDGTIATGASQTIRVGPSTFAATYEHMIRIIGHELQHVQQRTGATPIVNQDVREFLSYSWEALDTSAPPLTAADRVVHANLAIARYNRFSPAEKTTHNATYLRLQTLITNAGVGNP